MGSFSVEKVGHFDAQVSTALSAGMPVPARVPGHGGRYRFREYEPVDRKVLGILRAVAHDEPPTEAWGKPPHQSIVHRTVVVTDELERGRVIGAARVISQDDTDFPRVAHLQFVCVEEDKRGNGLGSALVRWTETVSDEQFRASLLELEVDRKNTRAIALYEKLGYQQQQETSAASKAWSENPVIRRMLGPPRVLRFVKAIARLAPLGEVTN